MAANFSPNDAGLIQNEIRISGLRRVPHNVEAEMALLGAILVNNRAYERVSDFLRPEHFVLAEHRLIFEAIVRLIERSQLADPITLKAYFEQGDQLDDVGGAAYLIRLADAAVTVINAGDYGRLLHDLALRRELIGLGEEVVNRAYDSEIDETRSSSSSEPSSIYMIWPRRVRRRAASSLLSRRS